MLKSSRGCYRRIDRSVVHGSKQSSIGSCSSNSSRSSSGAFCRDNSSRGHVFEINPSILNLPGTMIAITQVYICSLSYSKSARKSMHNSMLFQCYAVIMHMLTKLMLA